MEVNILFRKDQVDTTDDNKDVKLLKDELWTRQVSMEVEVIVIRKNQIIKETILLEEIRKNQTREQEVQKELERDDIQAWEDNGIVYVKERIYIPNNRNI